MLCDALYKSSGMLTFLLCEPFVAAGLIYGRAVSLIGVSAPVCKHYLHLAWHVQLQ